MLPQPRPTTSCPLACVIVTCHAHLILSPSEGLERPQQPAPRRSAPYPFLSRNGALPVHEVHRAVGVFCWDSHKALRGKHTQAHQCCGSPRPLLEGAARCLPPPGGTGLVTGPCLSVGPGQCHHQETTHHAMGRNKAFLTNGWSFLQAFLSWASLLRAIPDIFKVLKETAEMQSGGKLGSFWPFLLTPAQ